MNSATILVPIDLTQGPSAIDYTPTNTNCPVLGLYCATASGGTGTIKFTPLRAALATVGGSGSNARLRLACDSNGSIITAEVAAVGSGYTPGAVSVTLTDPFGYGGVISCTATAGGTISGCTITTGGTAYSGYISFSFTNFVEGVVYNMIPRFIELTTGATSSIAFIGQKLSYRPFETF